MKSVSIRELKSKLSYYLSNLPIEVYNRKELIARIYPANTFVVDKETFDRFMEWIDTPQPEKNIQNDKKDLAEKYPSLGFGKSPEQFLKEGNYEVKPKVPFHSRICVVCSNFQESTKPRPIRNPDTDQVGEVLLCDKHYAKYKE